MTRFDSEFGPDDVGHHNFSNPDNSQNLPPEPSKDTLEQKLEPEEPQVKTITFKKNLKERLTSLKEKCKNGLWQAAQFGAFGIAGEVIFTSIRNGIFHNGDIGLRGESYAWMLPIWMGAAPTYNLIAPKIQKYGVVTRAAIYGAAILGIEYACGYTLRETIGVCPWSEGYAGATCSVQDLIRLDWFPIWAGVGLAVEQLWKITTGYKKPDSIKTVNEVENENLTSE